MVRRFRRSMKRKLRRLFRRTRRSAFKRTFGTRKHRIPKVKPVSLRRKVKGIKKRLNNRPEMKRTVYVGQQTAIRTMANWDAGLANGILNTSLIWANNFNDAGITPWFPQPGQGPAENQMIGTKYNLKYAELTFILEPMLNQPTGFVDSIRLILIKERQSRQIITGPGAGAPTILRFTNFHAPVDTKKWDVQYDKIFPYTTGITTTAVPVGNVFNSLVPKPKIFRFIIPLKETLEYALPAINTPFTNSMYLFAFTHTQDNYWFIRPASCIYYYRDP